MNGEIYNNLYFEHLNNNDGLISDEVNASHQDANGFMWFATAEGIVRYDGYEFRSYKNNPHLGFLYGTQITSIKSSKEGSLFVGTSNGFYAFSNLMEPIYQYASNTIEGNVNDIFVASDDKIYVSCYNGFYILDVSSETILKVNDAVVKSNFTGQIIEDKNGRIWVGSWGKGLLKLNEDQKSFTKYAFFTNANNGSSDNSIKSLLIDSNGYMWVGTWDCGLYVLDIYAAEEPEIIKKFVHDLNNPNSIPGNIILSIEEDKFDGIWIGTPYGTAVICYPFTKNSKVIRYDYADGLGNISSNVVKHIYRDHNGLLWFATKGGGVNKLYLERNKFDHYIIPELDPQKRTQAVYGFEKDAQGRLLVGVLSQGFLVYDEAIKEFKQFSEFAEYKNISKKVDLNTVTSFLWDKDSVLWLGTRYNGALSVALNTGEIHVLNSSTTNGKFIGRNVNVQFLDDNGSVWIGTETALHHITYRGKDNSHIVQVKFFDIQDKQISPVNITGIVKDVSGRILVATYLNGIFELKNSNGKFSAHRWAGIDIPNKIVSLFEDGGGRVWIGTKGAGIKYVDKNTTEVKSPLPNVNIYGDVVYGIEQDDYGSVWLTTNKGLLKLWFHQGEVKTERFLHRDGLQGNIFIPRSIYKDDMGQLYIGGYNGFNKFNPLKVNGNYSKPPVVITDVFVEGEREPFFYKNDEVLKLNHNRNDFSVTFSALDYIYSEANQYAYKLEGIDNEWKYVSAKFRSVNYSNLPPGEYVLQVKGSNNQGIWNDDQFNLPIVVIPAPYKTWWAILGYIFIIIGIITLMFYQRLRLERIKQKYQLELLDKDKAEKLQEYKLRFFTNISHELLTPLSILSSVSENSMLKKVYSLNDNLIIQRNVNNLTRLIRQLLTFRKMESGNMSLKLEQGNISTFVITHVQDFKPLAEKRSMKFDIDITPDIMGVYDAEKLEIVLHNLLSNAFKYTEDGGCISCYLGWNKPKESIVLVVKDKGEGISKQALPNLFDRYNRGDKRESKGGVGIGLNLTKNLIDSLQGSISVESEKNVGSTFTVILPVLSNQYVNNVDHSVKGSPVFIDGEDVAEQEVRDDNLFHDKIPDGKFTILIAEDNDDFRSILQNSLSDYFKVLVAADGKEALELATENDIDLIVSDVMMPNMTGKELCVKVKSDINLSHIPVILLTAKTGEANRLAGYEAGADAYLEKPVVLKLLMVRITNLLKYREKFKQRVNSDEVSLEPENVTVTPLDQQFIIDAKSLVEKNLSDPDFTVKTMAEELNVTNSMLYRKIRSLAGLPPNEFIRSIRLKRAAQMLANKDFTISEVAFNCGFNDLGYFGVCFKKVYGKTPTVFQLDGND
jgi:signal transduction histidine kinase/ligand-binding sensor domain-containing protein/DNA-binding response OmpR family regulator